MSATILAVTSIAAHRQQIKIPTHEADNYCKFVVAHAIYKLDINLRTQASIYAFYAFMFLFK